MNRVSTKRRRELARYAKLKRKFLKANKVCFVCGGSGDDLHHMAGRTGRLLTEELLWRCVCRDCHRIIHEDPMRSVILLWLAPLGCWNDYARAVAWAERNK